jgi:hypothetical protein
MRSGIGPARRRRAGFTNNGEAHMDDTVNRLAKELAQAIRAAVAADPTVEACRAKARAAGYEMHLSIDAEVGFANRSKPAAMVKVRRAGAAGAQPGATQIPPTGPIGFTTPAGAVPGTSGPGTSGPGTGGPGTNGPGTHGIAPRRPSMRELSASDRLFLKSLRIAPDELPEVKG